MFIRESGNQRRELMNGDYQRHICSTKSAYKRGYGKVSLKVCRYILNKRPAFVLIRIYIIYHLFE